MNAFFGILDGSVAFMVTTFSTILYDAVRLIEEHWESWIEAIERWTTSRCRGAWRGIAFTCRLIIALRNACLCLSQFTSTGTPQAKPRASGGAAFDQGKANRDGSSKSGQTLITLLITIGVDSFAITSDRL